MCFVYFMSSSSSCVPRDAQHLRLIIRYMRAESSQSHGEPPLETPWLNSLAIAQDLMVMVGTDCGP